MNEISLKLTSDRLQEVLEGISALSLQGDLDWFSGEDFLGMCRVFEAEQFGFSDLLEQTRTVLALLTTHKEKLQDQLEKRSGSVRYMIGCLEECYDATGFVFLASSIELATALDLNPVVEALQAEAPEAASRIGEYQGVLRRIEGARHEAYQAIRRVGNRFVREAEQLVLSFRYGDADFILHAFDGFVGDPSVIEMYQRVLAETRENHPLREDVATYLERVQT